MVIPLVLLAIMVTTPITVIEDAFARYQRHAGGGGLSQAASIRNSCLNPVSNSNTNDNMISNGNCGGTVSQQGRSGQASTPTTVQSANPIVEVQRATTAQPPLTSTGGNCTACFDPLSASQKSELLIVLSEGRSPTIPPTVTTIAQLCEFLRGLSETDLVNAILIIQNELASLPDPVNVTTSLSIEKCLTQALQ